MLRSIAQYIEHAYAQRQGDVPGTFGKQTHVIVASQVLDSAPRQSLFVVLVIFNGPARLLARVRSAIEVITPEFELELPTAFLKVSERVPGILDVILTNDDYLAPIHDVAVRHVLGAQIGSITPRN